MSFATLQEESGLDSTIRDSFMETNTDFRYYEMERHKFIHKINVIFRERGYLKGRFRYHLFANSYHGKCTFIDLWCQVERNNYSRKREKWKIGTLRFLSLSQSKQGIVEVFENDESNCLIRYDLKMPYRFQFLSTNETSSLSTETLRDSFIEGGLWLDRFRSQSREIVFLESTIPRLLKEYSMIFVQKQLKSSCKNLQMMYAWEVTRKEQSKNDTDGWIATQEKEEKHCYCTTTDQIECDACYQKVISCKKNYIYFEFGKSYRSNKYRIIGRGPFTHFRTFALSVLLTHLL